MSEVLLEKEQTIVEVTPEIKNTIGKITVFEALAEESILIGPNGSKLSTPFKGDPDD